MYDLENLIGIKTQFAKNKKHRLQNFLAIN